MANSLFQRRHYEAMAVAMRQQNSREAIMDLFASDNPNFNRTRFVARVLGKKYSRKFDSY